MADLKRKQLRQFLSGSFNITGSLNVTGSVEFDKNVSGSITSTGSFSRLQGDTISVTHSPYASGSGVQALMDATGSYASASTKYVKESQTGSFGSGSDVQNILNTYVQQSESSSFASGSDLQVILAESSSYVVESETGSFLQFSDTASFSTLHVEGNITTSGSITAQRFNTEIVSSSVIFASGSTRFGDTIDDTHNITGSLFVSGNVTFDTNLTGSLTSTGSFGNIQIGNFGGLPFASGSDLHQILAQSASYVVESETSSLHQVLQESASYMVSDQTGSMGLVTLGNNITGSITSTGSFGRVDVAENTFILGNLGIGTSTQGDRLQVAGDATIVGALDVLNSVSGGLSSTGSFGWVEELGVKVVNSNQTASFASGSDLHTILAQSASYMMSDQTGSMGATTMASTLIVAGDISTSGSVIAREFKTEFVSSSIIFASGSQIFGDSEDDTHSFSGSVNIGDMVLSGSRVGVSSDLNLLTLSDNTLTINGSIVIDDGANIGIDADPNLLGLNDQNLIVNGILDSTGRIDAQSGLQVSGSSLQVGNDLTLNYTSPVSHSLMFVNYTNKTVDLLPPASSSGQLAQFNGTSWIITDEIDGGSF
jgi:hypothetical protein